MERCLIGTKNEIEKILKKIVYNFNPSNNFNIEWDNFRITSYRIQKNSSNKWMGKFIFE